ncbi:hypothetical protein cypCar_00017190, partial [Cyprinus carpio]
PISETTWTDLKLPVLVATNILWLVIIAILLCTVREYKNDKKHFLQGGLMTHYCDTKS